MTPSTALVASPVKPNHQKAGKSELASYNFSVALNDEWHGVSSTLPVVVWRAGRWEELKASRAGREWLTEPGAMNHVVQCMAAGEALLAVTSKGDVARFEAERWTKVAGGPKGFGHRDGFLACFDPSAGRVVCWGSGLCGIAPELESNETFFFADGAWKTPSHASPPPPDAEAARFQMFFDHASGHVVRLGKGAVGVLEGERWRTVEPAGYAGVMGHGAFIASDASTGQTLVLRGRRVYRFRLEGCEQVAELEPLVNRKLNTSYELVYLPQRRELHLQDSRVASTRGAIALGPLFDRLAGRTAASAAAAPKPAEGTPGQGSLPGPGPKHAAAQKHPPASSASKKRPTVPAALDARARATLKPFFSSLCTLELPKNLGGACNAWVFDWAGLRERQRDELSEFLIGLELERSVPFAVRVRHGGLEEMREAYGGSRSRWTLGQYLTVQHDGVLAVGEGGTLLLLDEGSVQALAPSLARVKLKKGVLLENE